MTENPPPLQTILLVDDRPANLRVLFDALETDGYRVLIAEDGEDCLKCAQLAQPDLILLDVMLPDISGFEVCRRLKAQASTQDIPVIFMTVLSNEANKVQGFDVGGVDYVSKPFELNEVRARVRTHMALSQYRRELRFQATHDALTQLPNRLLLQDRLGQAINYAGRYGHQLAVLYLDLDHFKYVNDSLGHSTGDQLLGQIAQRLLDCVRESDTVARQGGDEFVIVLTDQDNERKPLLAIRRIMRSILEPAFLSNSELRVSCSIGVALYPQDGCGVDTLLMHADTALHRAKELGRNNFQFFTQDMNERLQARMQLESKLRGALAREEFELFYQPQVDLKSGRIVGAEALIRWWHPEWGMLEPSRFIPLAEEIGLVLSIGRWALQEACRQSRAWLNSKLPVVPIAVNLSASQFLHQDLPGLVSSTLQQYCLPASLLQLELTESLSMQDVEHTISVLQSLRAIGVGIAIDDFGSGYSNLAYLKRFPIDKLKLDRPFVVDLPQDPDDLVITHTIIHLAHNLKLKVVAEGVESRSQLLLLRDGGCDEIQGHYFSVALPAEEFARLLQCGEKLPDSVLHREGGPEMLLLSDIDSALGAMLAQDLAGRSCQVQCAKDSADALEWLATHDVRVVVAMHGVREGRGADFLSKVGQMYPAVERVLLSAPEHAPALQKAAAKGDAFKLIATPWTRAEILQSLDVAAGYSDPTAFLPNEPPERSPSF